MPSRTHLLVIATALLLISIPVMYVCFTWTVEAPLSFRLLDYGTPVTTQNGFRNETAYEIPFHIEVRNTSAVAIQVHELRLRSSSRQVTPRGRFAHPGTAPGFSTISYDPPLIIEAHESARLVYISSGNAPGVLTSIEPKIAYVYKTRTQDRIGRWINHVRAWFPASTQKRFPIFKYHKGNAPLEIPDPLPASPTPSI